MRRFDLIIYNDRVQLLNIIIPSTFSTRIDAMARFIASVYYFIKQILIKDPFHMRIKRKP